MVVETYKLINAIKKMYPVVTFFKDRYFPDARVFYSEKVLVEMKKKGRKVAPFVIPVVGGIPMEDEGYWADELKAPYIAPKMEITADELEKKAFGESPESNRTPEEREREIQAEHMDDMRKSILRRIELMCTEIITTGGVVMKHFASAEDAAKDERYELKQFRYYGDAFKNRYRFAKDFRVMTAQERILEFYKIASILRKRGVRATDIVMTADVSMLLMTDPDFLEYYNKKSVETGTISQKELPEGVSENGVININGVVMTMFTYDCEYEDLDGTARPFLPAGTIVFLKPGIGETVYGQVTFVKGSGHVSYAEKIVPRAYADEKNNILEVQELSRPVPYPLDPESWIVCNINEEPEGRMADDEGMDAYGVIQDGVTMKSDGEIMAMTRKADVISYAESIGLRGLSEEQKLDDLKTAVVQYQNEVYGD